MLKKYCLSLAICLSLFAAGVCHADEISIQQDVHGVQYVTGGIGSEEVEAMEAFKKQFNLYFLFSEGKAGRVIDDIQLAILDSKNQEVFTLDHAAPRLLLNLPSGKYQAVASYLGSEQRYRFVHDAKKSKRIILNWKNKIDEDTVEPVTDDQSAEEPAPTATP
ncbi:hypothetical protein ACFQ1T_07960 [Methylophilus glucosoxydans]|jgi:hypothetical protein|uniref:Carboxypeptidase regulatory-like domain-containing protein n=1 Tax=Methylophilus glucosoxydans TaxID=752553 RepID=A0ABW3GGP1_9PROT|nr:hypothetical protein [Methylophilus sp. VKM B-3414]MDT7850364.1 hypothetical protein [Methylophilus sp. VKM B-3414]